ncbi:MAG: hypothetical protein MJ252_17110 [archaeon]|nr:hypothetical protein [archaeon]
MENNYWDIICNVDYFNDVPVQEMYDTVIDPYTLKQDLELNPKIRKKQSEIRQYYCKNIGTKDDVSNLVLPTSFLNLKKALKGRWFNKNGLFADRAIALKKAYKEEEYRERKEKIKI